jgi:RNA polymerase sigma-70 factor (ECF subfamily)
MNRKKDIEQLFRQHYAKMYNLARCILSDDDESKDVVSEVFAQILADDVVLVPGSEEGYLMRSVRNRCLNLIAHKSVKERVAKLLLDDADVILSEETDERLDRLMLLIEDLEPPIRQLIFRLRYLECKETLYFSTGICEMLTAGFGGCDEYGYFKYPLPAKFIDDFLAAK